MFVATSFRGLVLVAAVLGTYAGADLNGAQRGATGSLGGILINAQSGRPVRESPVFLAVPFSQDRLMVQILSDPRWVPVVGMSGELLWERCLQLLRKKQGILYLLPYTPGSASRELFVTTTDNNGTFSFQNVFPGTYYVLSGESPAKATSQLRDVFLIPAGPQGAAEGRLFTRNFLYLEGQRMFYVLMGEMTPTPYKVDAGTKTDVGGIFVPETR